MPKTVNSAARGNETVNPDAQAHEIKKLHTMAYYDALTKLPNRTLLFDRLSKALARAEKAESLVGILFMDLDDFKTVNDTFGHDFGDRLLQEVARRAQRVLRKSDMIARFSGDEFVVILEDIETVELATVTAKRLIAALCEPISIKHHHIYSTASIGISCYPDDGGIAKNLLQKADIAMYTAKKSGKNQCQRYSKPLNMQHKRSLGLIQDLSRALENSEFFLVYQPQYDLQSQRYTGAEVLIRWRHPSLGMISPVEFIPLAEMSGLINPITERIFIDVAARFKVLKSHGFENFTLSVNISPRMLFEPDFIPTLSFFLENYDIPSGKLHLEITENTFMNNLSELVKKLEQIRDMGFHLEIDDYGTGFTSLNYLINLPVSSLKIDRSFVMDIHQNEKNRAIAGAMITIGHHLGMGIIAEGAETEAETGQLRELKCDIIQGFYFSKPLPFERLITFLEESENIS